MTTPDQYEYAGKVTEEWYTPSDIIERARRVLGTIELDPASSDEAQAIVQAERYYTAGTNGLDKEWSGKVWLNPPYGGLGPKFMDKLWTSVLVKEYVLLTNSFTNSRWWPTLVDDATLVCFVRRPIEFHKATGGTTNMGWNGQVIAYRGSNYFGFIHEFADLGAILRGGIANQTSTGIVRVQ